ncbi:MAG: HAD-IIB family hydrolase [Alphaproteobacteria bacterium]
MRSPSPLAPGTPRHPTRGEQRPASRPVVFTDLDGTLLDHVTYDHSAAAPALEALRTLGCPLILASSKTAAEIGPLHRELALGDWPAIVENGAGELAPDSSDRPDDGTYRRLRDTLAQLPRSLSRGFRGFGDMTDAEVAAATGLSLDRARLARQRCHSEPGLWTGVDGDLAAFLEAIEARGLSARRGGRFLTLSFGHGKAERMRCIAERLGADLTIALGDAPNDIDMLEAADHGVLVRNDHAPPLPRLRGEDEGRIRRTRLSGPAGWNAAVLQLLRDLDLNVDRTGHG